MPVTPHRSHKNIRSREIKMKRERVSVAIVSIACLLAAAMAGADSPPASPNPSSPPAVPASPDTPSTPVAPVIPPAPAVDAVKVAYPEGNDRLDGDHLKLRVNVHGFKAIDGTDKGKEACAPKGSNVKVTRHKGEDLLVRIELGKAVKKAIASSQGGARQLENPGMFSTREATSPAALVDCGELLVNDYTQYTINAGALADHDYRRTGVLFGALIVPFKFHFGGDDKLSSSSTIAPYVGFTGPAPLGLTFTPIFSAGLGLVPVADPESGESETKSAFSTAIGVLLTHGKNAKFNAGVLLGKDFLSKSDRGADSTVDNLWFSLYTGYQL
jgi:hypothetical protein